MLLQARFLDSCAQLLTSKMQEALLLPTDAIAYEGATVLRAIVMGAMGRLFAACRIL